MLGVEFDGQQKQKAGMAFHYLAGLSWAPFYQWLRRRTAMTPITAGLLTGASISIVLDEAP